MFAALERALDLNGKGPLTLLNHYQTPAQLDVTAVEDLAERIKAFYHQAQPCDSDPMRDFDERGRQLRPRDERD